MWRTSGGGPLVRACGRDARAPGTCCSQGSGFTEPKPVGERFFVALSRIPRARDYSVPACSPDGLLGSPDSHSSSALSARGSDLGAGSGGQTSRGSRLQARAVACRARASAITPETRSSMAGRGRVEGVHERLLQRQLRAAGEQQAGGQHGGPPESTGARVACVSRPFHRLAWGCSSAVALHT